jgi:hypothetical protein
LSSPASHPSRRPRPSPRPHPSQHPLPQGPQLCHTTSTLSRSVSLVCLRWIRCCTLLPIDTKYFVVVVVHIPPPLYLLTLPFLCRSYDHISAGRPPPPAPPSSSQVTQTPWLEYFIAYALHRTPQGPFPCCEGVVWPPAISCLPQRLCAMTLILTSCGVLLVNVRASGYQPDGAGDVLILGVVAQCQPFGVA